MDEKKLGKSLELWNAKNFGSEDWLEFLFEFDRGEFSLTTSLGRMKIKLNEAK